MQRDYESIILVTDIDSIAIVASAPVTTLGTALDTQGLRGLVFAGEPDEAISTDVAHWAIYECDESGGTYTVVDDSKYLPTDGARLITDVTGGFINKFAATSTKRYIKPAVIPTTIADDITFSVTVIKFPELVDAGDLGPADALP